jgi:hypothetical protein
MALSYLYLISTYTEDGHCHGVNTSPPPPPPLKADIIPIIKSGTVSHNEGRGNRSYLKKTKKISTLRILQ